MKAEFEYNKKGGGLLTVHSCNKIMKIEVEDTKFLVDWTFFWEGDYEINVWLDDDTEQAVVDVYFDGNFVEECLLQFINKR